MTTILRRGARARSARTGCGALLPLLFAVAACGGAETTPAAAAPTGAVSVSAAPGVTPPATAGAQPAPAGGGGHAVAGSTPPPPSPPPPPPHPFAATSAEATSLIDAAIDERASSLLPCVAAARTRRKNPHEKIQIEVGLDEQGHLMGVKAPKGAPSDPELFHCAQDALTGANFPTSHAGIITVTKTFEDQAVYR
jgi:hypothetical protein